MYLKISVHSSRTRDTLKKLICSNLYKLVFFCFANFKHKRHDLTEYELTVGSFVSVITFMSIIPTAIISLCALSGQFQSCKLFFEVLSWFSVCNFGHTNHFIQFNFESLLRPSYDPSPKLPSCTIPGLFQSSNRFQSLLLKPFSLFLVQHVSPIQVMRLWQCAW